MCEVRAAPRAGGCWERFGRVVDEGDGEVVVGAVGVVGEVGVGRWLGLLGTHGCAPG